MVVLDTLCTDIYNASCMSVRERYRGTQGITGRPEIGWYMFGTLRIDMVLILVGAALMQLPSFGGPR